MYRKKIHSFILLLLLIAAPSRFSIAKIHKLAPGIFYQHIYDPQGPWSINILEVQLSDSSLHLRTTKARNLVAGNQQTSVMAKQLERNGYTIVGGINGDFYAANGTPIGTQILEGKILKDPSNRALFMLTDEMKPAIEVISLDAWFICENRKRIRIDGINRSREVNEVILYNSFRGMTTGTNKWGFDLILCPISDFSVGDTIWAVVTSVAHKQANPTIPPEAMVVSGHGKAEHFLMQNVSVQDTVALLITLPSIFKPIREAIGGIPRIIRDGRVSIEIENQSISESFVLTQHPRTAVGFNQDSTKLLLVTVDGRQPGHSIGMSLSELANFMLSLGCSQAINLDGGGSTTMLVGTRVVNRPSDASGERAVANALLVISTAPEDSLAGLRNFLSKLEK